MADEHSGSASHRSTHNATQLAGGRTHAVFVRDVGSSIGRPGYG